MNWFLLSITSAIFVSLTDLTCKHLLKKRTHLEVAVIRWLYSIPFLIPSGLSEGRFNIGIELLRVLLILVPLEITAIILFMRAIKTTDLSLSIPLFSWTPVFLILTSIVILGEKPLLPGIIGIILIGFGTYMLNFEKISRRNLIAPLIAIWENKGSFLIMVVSFIYSITSAFGKKAVLLTGPFSFSLIYLLILVPIVIVIMHTTHQGGIKMVIKPDIWHFITGFFSALMILSHFYAISLNLASYTVAVKRTSIFFTVLGSGIFFNERVFGTRIIGTIIMLIGVFIIYIVS